MPVGAKPLRKNSSNSSVLIEPGATSRNVKGRKAEELPISRAYAQAGDEIVQVLRVAQIIRVD